MKESMSYAQSSACHVVSTQIFIIIINYLFRRFKISRKKFKETMLPPYKERSSNGPTQRWNEPSQVVMTFPSVEMFSPRFRNHLAE